MTGVLPREGKHYFVTFIDDASQCTYVYLLHTKDEATDCFKIYKADIENVCNTKIKTLHTDCGRACKNSS